MGNGADGSVVTLRGHDSGMGSIITGLALAALVMPYCRRSLLVLDTSFGSRFPASVGSRLAQESKTVSLRDSEQCVNGQVWLMLSVRLQSHVSEICHRTLYCS